MLIAHVAPFFYPEIGGMENAVLNQCQELVNMGHEVHVYTCDRLRNGTKIRNKYSEINNISVHYLRSYFHIEKAHFFPSLLIALTNEDYDIIHTHAIHHPHNDLAALAGKIKHRNIVFTSHSSFFPKKVVPGYQHFLFAVYDTFAKFSIFRNADRIIALTPYDNRELMKRGVSREKIRIIPNGVEQKYFKFHDGEEFRSRYDLNGNIILSVTRLNKIKRLDVLLLALSLILKENRDVQLVLVGPDEGYYSYLRNLSEKLGIQNKVIWLGRLKEEEKIAAYYACDVFCLTSDLEPFGIVLLESQAAGRPVVAVRSGGAPYIVKEDETGILVPPGDFHGIANALLLLLEDDALRNKMGRHGVKWASNFTWQSITRKIAAVYEELL